MLRGLHKRSHALSSISGNELEFWHIGSIKAEVLFRELFQDTASMCAMPYASISGHYMYLQ